MFLVRLVGLLLLALFCFGMGTIPANEANGIARTFAPLFFVVAPVLYFLPTIEAYLNDHGNMAALGALNLLLGWTVVGWVAALVWALTKQASRPTTPEPSWASSPLPSTAVRPTPNSTKPAEEKICPYCAESIKAAAKVCKHCGRDQPDIKGD